MARVDGFRAARDRSTVDSESRLRSKTLKKKKPWEMYLTLEAAA